MKKSSPEDKEEKNPNLQSIWQSLLSNLKVGRDLIVGNINQQIFIGGDAQFQRQQRRNRRDLALLEQVKNEVVSRLAQSLHNRVLIDLSKEEQPGRVQRPWDTEIKVGIQPNEPLPPDERLIDFFDRETIAGKFLILGQPGAGKTIMLLELAKELVARALGNPDFPIPILLNLSSWKDDRQSIYQWLVTELKDKYGVREDIGKKWLSNHELLPLLDGLDELVSSERQERCVQAINQFLASEERPPHLVVCSRSRDRESKECDTRLQLNGALYLQPLSERQIRHYLVKTGNLNFLEIINSDSQLIELIKTPFFMSITTLVYTKVSSDDLQSFLKNKDYINYLLSAYVQIMLARDINSKAYYNQKFPNSKQVQNWLNWLTIELQEKSTAEFSIERIQPTLLKNFWHKNFYALGVGLSFGLFGGVIVGSLFYLNSTSFLDRLSSIFIGIAIGTFFGIFFGIWAILTIGQSKEIKPVETLILSWNNIFRSLRVSLVVGAIAWFVTQLLFTLIGWDRPPWLLYLIISPILVTIFEIGGPEIQNIKKPNQGIIQSLKNAISFALLGGGCMGLAAYINREKLFLTLGSLFLPLSDRSLPLILSETDTVNVVLSGILVGLLFGLTQAGTACIQHFVLRFVLYCKGDIPCNYARFLNYATERMFLQRVGGRYIFIHRLLQEYFAEPECSKKEL